MSGREAIELERDQIDPRVFWPCFVIGMAAVVWGLRLVWVTHVDVVRFAGWLVGGVLVHDLVIAPLTLAIGVVLARVLPPWLRAPVQVGAILTGVVLLFSIPGLVDAGHNARNPSVLPNDYPLGVAIILGAVWLAVAVAIVARRSRSVEH